MVLHVLLSSETERIIITWQFGDTVLRQFIFEDVFDTMETVGCVSGCNGHYFDCCCYHRTQDTHSEADLLRQKRIRAYRTTRVVQLDGCQSSFFYHLDAYLVVDNTTVEDSGEYIFNSTVTHTGALPITITRSVNVSVGKYRIYMYSKTSDNEQSE